MCRLWKVITQAYCLEQGIYDIMMLQTWLGEPVCVDLGM